MILLLVYAFRNDLILMDFIEKGQNLCNSYMNIPLQ